jgi:hypothetical protein
MGQVVDHRRHRVLHWGRRPEGLQSAGTWGSGSALWSLISGVAYWRWSWGFGLEMGKGVGGSGRKVSQPQCSYLQRKLD